MRLPLRSQIRFRIILSTRCRISLQRVLLRAEVAGIFLPLAPRPPITNSVRRHRLPRRCHRRLRLPRRCCFRLPVAEDFIEVAAVVEAEEEEEVEEMLVELVEEVASEWRIFPDAVFRS